MKHTLLVHLTIYGNFFQMINKNKIKLIRSLSYKKYREKENLFLGEGNKLTRELLTSGWDVRTLICTDTYYQSVKNLLPPSLEWLPADPDEIRKYSLLKNPQQAMVLCTIPQRKFSFEQVTSGLTLCLDGIQDPGNLGTILRIADWFGISVVCASPDTADVFNPKTVQASMGSILRVTVVSTNLERLIKKANQEKISTFGTFLSGTNIYTRQLPETALVVLGNEGNGISPTVESLIGNKLFIPPVAAKEKPSESLNVAAAAAIICSEFKRTKLLAYSK
jgi:RNA methyltransferase, TrmH family